jgi:hypothetical protein
VLFSSPALLFSLVALLALVAAVLTARRRTEARPVAVEGPGERMTTEGPGEGRTPEGSAAAPPTRQVVEVVKKLKSHSAPQAGPWPAPEDMRDHDEWVHMMVARTIEMSREVQARSASFRGSADEVLLRLVLPAPQSGEGHEDAGFSQPYLWRGRYASFEDHLRKFGAEQRPRVMVEIVFEAREPSQVSS